MKKINSSFMKYPCAPHWDIKIQFKIIKQKPFFRKCVKKIRYRKNVVIFYKLKFQKNQYNNWSYECIPFNQTKVFAKWSSPTWYCDYLNSLSDFKYRFSSYSHGKISGRYRLMFG